MRITLLGVDPEGPLARLIRNRIYCVSSSVFALSNGELYAQTTRGIMLSGWYNTSSSNSRIVVLNTVLSGAVEWAIAMGDDFLCDDVPGFKDKFESHGHILKLFKRVDDKFEFCSTSFPSFEPSNVWKIFVKLLSNGTKSLWERRGLYVDWRSDMRHSPEMGKLDSLVIASGFLSDLD
jgi:hypothetical protein